MKKREDIRLLEQVVRRADGGKQEPDRSGGARRSPRVEPSWEDFTSKVMVLPSRWARLRELRRLRAANA